MDSSYDFKVAFSFCNFKENFEPEMKLQVHQATNFADVVNLMRMDEVRLLNTYR